MADTRPVSAALFVLASMAVIGFIDNFVIVIAEQAGLWQFHLMRALMALPLVWLLARFGLGSLRTKNLAYVLLRSALISISMMFYFGSLAFLPISEAVAGLFTAPLWVLLVSVTALGQTVGPIRIGAALIGFLGVLLVLRPDAGGVSIYTLLPLAGGFFYALGNIVTREKCATESPAALVAWFFVALGVWSLLGLIVLAVVSPDVPTGADGFLLRGWVLPTQEVLFWTGVQAVGAICAIGFLTRGYQLADASFVAVFEYALLIFVSAWAWMLRGELIDTPAAIGIALIVLSGAVIAVRGRTA